MGLWARWRAFCESLETKQQARLEEERRRELEREHEKDRGRARREEYDEYGRAKRRVILTDTEIPLFTLLFCGFVLGFGATFGWLLARYLVGLVAQLR